MSILKNSNKFQILADFRTKMSQNVTYHPHLHIIPSLLWTSHLLPLANVTYSSCYLLLFPWCSMIQLMFGLSLMEHTDLLSNISFIKHFVPFSQEGQTNFRQWRECFQYIILFWLTKYRLTLRIVVYLHGCRYTHILFWFVYSFDCICAQCKKAKQKQSREI